MAWGNQGQELQQAFRSTHIRAKKQSQAIGPAAILSLNDAITLSLDTFSLHCWLSMFTYSQVHWKAFLWCQPESQEGLIGLFWVLCPISYACEGSCGKTSATGGSSLVVQFSLFLKKRAMDWEHILTGVCTLSKFPPRTEEKHM